MTPNGTNRCEHCLKLSEVYNCFPDCRFCQSVCCSQCGTNLDEEKGLITCPSPECVEEQEERDRAWERHNRARFAQI